MDYELISTMGFPIAMCVYMMLFFNTTIKNNTDATVELRVLLQQLLFNKKGDK